MLLYPFLSFLLLLLSPVLALAGGANADSPSPSRKRFNRRPRALINIDPTIDPTISIVIDPTVIIGALFPQASDDATTPTQAARRRALQVNKREPGVY
ncbi:WD40 repeat-like protein [Pseudohyphozyma bogoriensis]|nr:WD40 repeat-like protein [Pseudohyphozyma bogoriensis]